MRSHTETYFREKKIPWPSVHPGTPTVILFRGEELEILPHYGRSKWVMFWGGRVVRSRIADPRAAARSMARSLATKFMQDEKCFVEQRERSSQLRTGSSGTTLINMGESGIVHAPVCPQE